MAVLIKNNQKRHKISPASIRSKAQAILNALDCPDGELSILITDDPQIAQLNAAYLDRQGPTNVIAFPMQEGPFAELTPLLLGDVVISADTAAREGEAAGTDLQERLLQLLIHGILHLFGYDHETNEDDARRMEAKAQALRGLFEAA